MSEQLENRWNRVLVGVDGSPASRRALAFAENEARMRGADLAVVVTSIDVPDEMWLRPYADLLPSANLIAKAKERASTVIAEELGDQPAVRAAWTRPRHPRPPRWLTGRRKRTCSWSAHAVTVASAVWRCGSVSTQCVMHAHCPVTVVRARAAQPATAAELTAATAKAT